MKAITALRRNNLLLSRCLCGRGEYRIVEGLEINDFSRKKLKETEIQLIEEERQSEHLMRFD